MFTIWTAKDNHRVTVKSDGRQFYAQIHGGYGGETYLSVGYSCPNEALSETDAIVQPEAVDRICEILDAAWKITPRLDLDDMLPALYNLCRTANSIYNQELCSERWNKNRDELNKNEN